MMVDAEEDRIANIQARHAVLQRMHASSLPLAKNAAAKVKRLSGACVVCISKLVV